MLLRADEPWWALSRVVHPSHTVLDHVACSRAYRVGSVLTLGVTGQQLVKLPPTVPGRECGTGKLGPVLQQVEGAGAAEAQPEQGAGDVPAAGMLSSSVRVLGAHRSTGIGACPLHAAT